MQDSNRGIDDARERRVPPAAAGDASRREPVIGASAARRDIGDRIPPTELLRQLVEATPKTQTGLRTLFDALYRQMQELDSERRGAQAERDQLREQLQSAMERPPGSGRGWVAWVLLVAAIGGSGYLFAVPDLADQLRTKLRHQVAVALDLATGDDAQHAAPKGERPASETRPLAARDVGAAIPQPVPGGQAATPVGRDQQGVPTTAATPQSAARPDPLPAAPLPAAAPPAAPPATQQPQSEAARSAVESSNGRVAALEAQIESLTKRLAERESERTSQSTELKEQLAALERRMQEQQARPAAAEKAPPPAATKQARPLPGPPILPQPRATAAPTAAQTAVAPAAPVAPRAAVAPPPASPQAAEPVTASASGSLGTLPARIADQASAQPAPPTSLLPQAQSEAPEVLGWIRAKEGDTIRSIAREQGIDLLKLARANGVDLLDTNRPLKAGDRVTLPKSP